MIALVFDPNARKKAAAREAAALAAGRETQIAGLISDAAEMMDENGSPTLAHGTHKAYDALTDDETIVLAYLLRKVCKCNECAVQFFVSGREMGQMLPGHGDYIPTKQNGGAQ